MTTLVYPNNFDQIGDWLTDTYLMLLHDRDTFTADPTLITVADVIAEYGETAAAGYSRAPMLNPVRTVTDTPVPGSIALLSDEFDFGSPAVGQWDAATLYREVTNDADSLVLATYTFNFMSADGNPVILFPAAIGVLTLTTQQAPDA